MCIRDRLQSVLDEVRTVPVPELHGVPLVEVPPDAPAPETGVERETLLEIAHATICLLYTSRPMPSR